MDPAPPSTAPRDIFDRGRRRMARDRAAAQSEGRDFLAPMIAESLLDRLSMVTRAFREVLLIGAQDAALTAALRARYNMVQVVESAPRLAQRAGALVMDEDRMVFDAARFDLIVWPGGMESVNDVPGALLRCRSMLRPDGLLVGTLTGDGSFPRLRSAMRAADGDRGVARMHPQIDVRTLGDLLTRTGFAMPVADVEALTVGYASLGALVSDIRAAALEHCLAGTRPALGKAGLAKASQTFAQMGDDNGRTYESIRLLHFSGWSPDASQPKPAKRGSATASLADALKVSRDV